PAAGVELGEGGVVNNLGHAPMIREPYRVYTFKRRRVSVWARSPRWPGPESPGRPLDQLLRSTWVGLAGVGMAGWEWHLPSKCRNTGLRRPMRRHVLPSPRLRR